jgi:hypothetical protein
MRGGIRLSFLRGSGLVDLESEPDPLPEGSRLVRWVGVTLRRVRPTGVTLLLRVGVLLRGFLTTNGPGREIGTTTGGATSRVGHFVADDSLGVDKLELEEPSLPVKGRDGFPGRGFCPAGMRSDFSFLWRFGWLEARFEFETGRSSWRGCGPAK